MAFLKFKSVIDDDNKMGGGYYLTLNSKAQQGISPKSLFQVLSASFRTLDELNIFYRLEMLLCCNSLLLQLGTSLCVLADKNITDNAITAWRYSVSSLSSSEQCTKRSIILGQTCTAFPQLTWLARAVSQFNLLAEYEFPTACAGTSFSLLSLFLTRCYS